MKINDASVDKKRPAAGGGPRIIRDAAPVPRIVPKKGPRITRDGIAPRIVRPAGGAR
jgi:hypothetical protein